MDINCRIQNTKDEETDFIVYQTEAVKLENEAAELVQALQDNREQIKQWAVDRWDRAGSKQDAVIDYAKQMIILSIRLTKRFIRSALNLMRDRLMHFKASCRKSRIL